jgi:DNA primase
MILRKSIEEVIDTARIEEIVGDYVNLKKRGTNLIGLCPFHNEKSPSFIVSPVKGIFKCFGCGKAGNSVQFIIEHDSLSFPEAIRQIAKKYSIQLEETEVTAEIEHEKQLIESLYIINNEAKDFFQEQLLNTEEGKTIGLSYFKERGLLEETIKNFELGYSPKMSTSMYNHLKNKKFSIEIAQKAGLVSNSSIDFFRERIMFPIHNISGKVAGFGGRVMITKPNVGKYINSPETEIYNKSNILYGLFQAKKAIQKVDTCIIVEGYLDVISLHQNGVENVVASSGTALTSDQIRLIKRYTNNIKILFDGDSAGVKAATKGIDLVLEQSMNVMLVPMPTDDDPDSLIRKLGQSEFLNYMNKNEIDAIIYKAKLAQNIPNSQPIEKAKLINDLITTLGKIIDPSKRNYYIKDLVELLKYDEKLLISEINKKIKFQLNNRKDESVFSPKIQEKTTENDIENQAEENLTEVLANNFFNKDELQERYLIQIMIKYGNEKIDDSGKLLSQYIIENIEDIIEQMDNPIYKKMFLEVKNLYKENTIPNVNDFIHHQDEKIRMNCAELLLEEYEYSKNWLDKHDMALVNQKAPELNFLQDTKYSILKLKIKKLDKQMDENQQKMKTGKTEEIDFLMKIHMKLLDARNQISNMLNAVVLK